MIPLLASGIAAAYNSDDSGSKTNGLDKNNTGLSESWLKEQSPVVLDGTLISAAHGSYDELDVTVEECEATHKDVNTNSFLNLKIWKSSSTSDVFAKIPEDDLDYLAQNPIFSEAPLISDSKLLPHVDKIHHYLTDSRQSIAKKYSPLSKFITNSQILKNLNEIPYSTSDTESNEDSVSKECSPDPPTSVESEDLQLDSIQYTPGVSEAEIFEERKQNRLDILKIFVDRELSISEKATATEVLTSKTNDRLNVCVKSLSFENMVDCPIFCSMGLYEISSKGHLKLSDNFYFHFNSSAWLKLISESDAEIEKYKCCTEASFTLPAQHKDLYLMVRFEKVLEKDAGTLSSRLSSSKTKLEEFMNAAYKSLGQYSQPLGFSFVPLFQSDNCFAFADDENVSVKPIFKYEGEKISDEDLAATILSFKKSSTAKRKTIPGSLDLKINFLHSGTDEESNGNSIVYTTEYFDPLKSLQSILNFKNQIFLYLINLNFSKIGIKARNIVIQTQVFDAADNRGSPLKTHMQPLGYAVLPIFENNQLVFDGLHELPICINLTKDYMDEKIRPLLRIYDVEKATFTIKTQTVSSVYSTNKNINEFLIHIGLPHEMVPLDVIENLTKSSVAELFKFFPILIDQMLDLLASVKSNVVSEKVFESLLMLVLQFQKQSDEVKSSIYSYIQAFQSSVEKINHLLVIIPKLFCLFYKNNDDFIKASWFFVSLLSQLLFTISLKDEKSRKFSDSVPTPVVELIQLISQDIGNRSDVSLKKDLNDTLATFICDLFRTFNTFSVFHMIKYHLHLLSKTDGCEDFECKLEFLRVICSFEHFVPLNFPTNVKSAPKNSSVLKEYLKRHYLAGLLVKEVVRSLSSNHKDIRMKSLKLLKDVLTKIDFDERYQEPELSGNFGKVIKSTSPLSQAEKRLLSLCILHLLKNLDRRVLFKWIKGESIFSFYKFVDLIIRSLENLKFSSVDGKQSDAKAYIENINKTAQGQSLRETRGQLLNYTKGVVKKIPSIEDKTQCLISQEIGLIALDIFDSLVQEFSDAEKFDKELEKLFEILTQIFYLHQAESVVLYAFKSLKCFIMRYPSFIFAMRNEVCPIICQILFRNLSSSSANIRKYAATLIYLMLRKNHELTHSYAKTRIQIIIASSKPQSLEEFYIRKSLATVKKWSELDPKARMLQLAPKISKLADSLYFLARDIIRLSKYSADSEMLADLHYRIAQEYIHAPDLRLASFENLTDLHLQNQRYAEAALCSLHSAALVYHYLCHATPSIKTFLDAQKFLFCSLNVHEEIAFENEGFSMKALEEEGLCQTPSFTERGLITLLEAAAVFFRKANFHELCIESLKLVLPFHEKELKYERLYRIHGQIQQLYDEIIKANSFGKRAIGSFYRVAFYGNGFEELNGKEFIYKEKSFAPLSEVSNKFKELFTAKFGTSFELIQDSSRIDESKLDPAKVYIQITFVEPFLSPKDLECRKSLFSKVSNLNRFYFDTPFTDSGKAHGGIEEQKKRRTVLTTEAYFPFVKGRLLVVDREEIVQSPLEVSIEAIKERSSKLLMALSANPPNPKSLQIVLQGSVRLQVNSGPLEIAHTFLRKEVILNYPQNLIDELRAEFIKFVDQCRKAVVLNRSLIKEDQVEYQKDLEIGCQDLEEKMTPYIRNSMISPVSDLPPSPVSPLDGSVPRSEVNSILLFLQKKSENSSVTLVKELENFFS